MSDNIDSIFKIITAIINLIAIAMFFNKIYTAIFDYLLAVRSIKGRLFGPLSTYFRIVETNEKGILYLYCFLKLKKMSNLSNF